MIQLHLDYVLEDWDDQPEYRCLFINTETRYLLEEWIEEKTLNASGRVTLMRLGISALHFIENTTTLKSEMTRIME